MKLYKDSTGNIFGFDEDGSQDHLIQSDYILLSEEEIHIKEEQDALNSCKGRALTLIMLTDWTMLSDINIDNKEEFKKYRATLRGLITNPVVNPEWPTEPQPIWSN